MAELEQTTVEPDEETKDETQEDAPYGYKADGTPRKRPGRKAGVSSGGRKKSFEQLREPLAERIVEYFGPPIGLISPLGLAVIDDRAEKTADALCTLASTRPRVAKLIQGVIAGSASVDLMMTGVALLVAIGVDFQRIDPYSMPSHFFKIDSFYEQIFPAEAAARQNGAKPRGLINEVE